MSLIDKLSRLGAPGIEALAKELGRGVAYEVRRDLGLSGAEVHQLETLAIEGIRKELTAALAPLHKVHEGPSAAGTYLELRVVASELGVNTDDAELQGAACRYAAAVLRERFDADRPAPFSVGDVPDVFEGIDHLEKV